MTIFIYLQGSQTANRADRTYECFTPLFTYKVLKLFLNSTAISCSFTPLFTYKVLKPTRLYAVVAPRFTPLFTYKVLKLWDAKTYKPAEFYTFIYLQGSQTVSVT